MAAILRFVWRTLPFLACALPFLLLWRWLRLRRLRQRGVATTPAHEIILLLFCLFLVGLATLTVLPRLSWEGGCTLCRSPAAAST